MQQYIDMEQYDHDKCHINLQLQEKDCFNYDKTKSRFFTNSQEKHESNLSNNRTTCLNQTI